MKATTNNDPMVRRQLRGRRIARGIAVAALAVFGLTAWIKPELFSNELDMPTAEERERARQQRKSQAQKRPRVLSQEDIERLANLRKERYRKQLIESITKLEERVIVAEQMEEEATARFRNDPKTLPSLENVIPRQAKEAKDRLIRDYLAGTGGYSAYGAPGWKEIDHQSGIILASFKSWQDKQIQVHIADAADKLHQATANMIWETKDGPGTFSVETQRLTRTLAGNAKAFATDNVDLALRGHASAADHPLTPPQRADIPGTLSPMTIAQLHELSQELAAHYSDLMGDVSAAELAEVADITFPEAIEKLAHESFVEDNMADDLDGLENQRPLTAEELEALSEKLQAAAASAARAVMESTPASEGGT